MVYNYAVQAYIFEVEINSGIPVRRMKKVVQFLNAYFFELLCYSYFSFNRWLEYGLVIIRTNRIEGSFKGLSIGNIYRVHSAEIFSGSNIYRHNTMRLVCVIIQPDDFTTNGDDDISTGFNRPIIVEGDGH
jgi:hypothetical protein